MDRLDQIKADRDYHRRQYERLRALANMPDHWREPPEIAFWPKPVYPLPPRSELPGYVYA